MMHRALCFLVLSLFLGLDAWADAPVTIEPIPTRQFGYQLGDVVLDRADVRVKSGLTLDTSALPKLGKRFGAFMVRAIHIDPLPARAGEDHFALTLEMQMINTPATIKAWTVPPIQLKFLGSPPVETSLPSLTIDVAPLHTGDIRTGLPEIMGLRNAPLLNFETHLEDLKQFGAISGVLALWTVVTLVIGWRRRRAARPFRDTRRQLSKSLNRFDSIETARPVFIQIHRAFDDTWGHRLFQTEVQAFCEKNGANADLTQLTLRFFKNSERIFFSDSTEALDFKALKTELKALLGLWQTQERKLRR